MTHPAPLPVPVAALPTPALLVDLAAVAANVGRMAALARQAGVALRPHFKTSKCLEVARQQRDAGAVGFTCATPGEVRLLQDWLSQDPGPGGDLLWGHQPVGPARVAFAIEAVRRGSDTGTTVTVGLDSLAAARPLAEAARDAGVTVPYFLEVDTGLGRAGVDPDGAVAVAAELAALPGLLLRGVFTHEGHVAAHYGDRAAIQAAGRQVGETLAAVGAALRGAGHPCETVSVGSTPAADSSPFAPGVTEARPGTYVFHDGNQVALGSAAGDQVALRVLARVVSTPRPGAAIIDAGLKAMSGDLAIDGAGLGHIDGHPEVRFGKANEEHGYLSGPATAALSVGDLLTIVPNHACNTVNMWSGMYVVEGPTPEGTAVERWPIQARY